MTASPAATDDTRSDGTASRAFGGAFDLEELRRRNPVAIGMDVLYLGTTAFFAYLGAEGWAEFHIYVLDTLVRIPHPGWPAVITAVPLATLLYFGWSSSRAFFVAQVLTIVATAAASVAGLLSL